MNRLYARRFNDELHEEYPDRPAAWYAFCDAHATRRPVASQRQPPRFTLAITGGTGAYNTARGQVRIVDLNATDSRLTLTLIR
jgi:hypothetical protein